MSEGPPAAGTAGDGPDERHDLPVLDVTELGRITGGDAALIADLLGLFQEQAGLWLARLDPALPERGWYDLAHGLKGSARTVGAQRLAALAQTAEAAAGARPERRSALLVLLSTCLEETCAAIRAHLSAGSDCTSVTLARTRETRM